VDRWRIVTKGGEMGLTGKQRGGGERSGRGVKKLRLADLTPGEEGTHWRKQYKALKKSVRHRGPTIRVQQKEGNSTTTRKEERGSRLRKRRKNLSLLKEETSKE